MAETLNYTGTLVVVTCWCGMRHAVPKELRDYQERQHRDGASQQDIYCPLGHRYIISGKGEAARLRQQLDHTETQRKQLKDQLDATERSNRALRGVVTKVKRRIGKGVCPCCNRHFANVERHMASQHPEFHSDGCD